MFLPAICLYPVWLCIGTRESVLVSSIMNYYPMMIAMVIGSMIAGSTPLGGGVVAFPVSVLILGFTPSQGRDFSLLIQSVGMTAASFLIFLKKISLLRDCEDILTKFCILSIIGMIFGFEFLNDLSPFVVNLVYTTTVACIVLILAYSDFVDNQRKKCLIESYENQEKITPQNNDCDNVDLCENEEEIDVEACSGLENNAMAVSRISNSKCWIDASLRYICLPLFAIFGGILSSQIGSGADISCFFYGCFYNTIVSRNGSGKETQSSPNTLTAVSVIVMANTSVFGSILRLTKRDDPTMIVDDNVYYALVACVPIVVLGAPIGSLFLTPSNQQRLKYIFYILGIVQLLSFGAIKIKDDHVAWIVVAGTISLTSACLCVHYFVFSRGSTITRSTEN